MEVDNLNETLNDGHCRNDHVRNDQRSKRDCEKSSYLRHKFNIVEVLFNVVLHDMVVWFLVILFNISLFAFKFYILRFLILIFISSTNV